jgi:hypothetical protein
MSQKPIALALDSAREQQELVPPGTAVRMVVVRNFTPGTDLQLHIGESQAVEIYQDGDGWEFDVCDPHNAGIYVSNSAQAGVECEVLVIYAGSRFTRSV